MLSEKTKTELAEILDRWDEWCAKTRRDSGSIEAFMLCVTCESQVPIFIPQEDAARLQYLVGRKSKDITCLGCRMRKQEEQLDAAEKETAYYITIYTEERGRPLPFYFFKGRPTVAQLVSTLKLIDR